MILSIDPVSALGILVVLVLICVISVMVTKASQMKNYTDGYQAGYNEAWETIRIENYNSSRETKQVYFKGYHDGLQSNLDSKDPLLTRED